MLFVSLVVEGLSLQTIVLTLIQRISTMGYDNRERFNRMTCVALHANK